MFIPGEGCLYMAGGISICQCSSLRVFVIGMVTCPSFLSSAGPLEHQHLSLSQRSLVSRVRCGFLLLESFVLLSREAWEQEAKAWSEHRTESQETCVLFMHLKDLFCDPGGIASLRCTSFAVNFPLWAASS